VAGNKKLGSQGSTCTGDLATNPNHPCPLPAIVSVISAPLDLPDGDTVLTHWQTSTEATCPSCSGQKQVEWTFLDAAVDSMSMYVEAM
jgi:hypothetical protein